MFNTISVSFADSHVVIMYAVQLLWTRFQSLAHVYAITHTSRLQLANDTVVNIWKTTPQPALEMSKVTAAGYKAISSSCWYLNRIAYGENWQSYYMCDPQVSQLNAQLILLCSSLMTLSSMCGNGTGAARPLKRWHL